VPFSRRYFVQSSLAAAIPRAMVRKTWLERLACTSLRRLKLPSPDSPIFLDHNENAYGPSERVHAVLASSSDTLSNRYPRGQYDALRNQLAALHAIDEKQVLLGCGSSEILRMAATRLVADSPKRRCLIQALPTYPCLGQFARSVGVNVIDVPLNKRFEHDLDAMLKHAAKENASGLIYICNPNNPTGTLTERADIEAFVHKLPHSFIVLIDEAYSHFVSPHTAYASFLDKPVNDPRIIVCRTFSKVYGLAGMRIGYAVGHPDVLQTLAATQLRYGIPTLAPKAALAAIEDADYVSAAIARNADDRQEFMNQTNIRMLRAINSHANFVALDPLRPSEMVLEHLKTHNILVAPVIPPMNKYIRVSLGTPDEMREFWRVMDLLPPTGKMAM
jgi:histidinol-phosphate aminotransferase